MPVVRRLLVPLVLLAALLGAEVQAARATLQTGATVLVSRPSGFDPFTFATDGQSYTPVGVSADGRYVAFTSHADGFAEGAASTVAQVFVRDTAQNTTTLVSRSDGATGAVADTGVSVDEGNRHLGVAVLPGAVAVDGPKDVPHVLVVFTSKATNLVDHRAGKVIPSGGRREVWVRDVTAGTTRLVSRGWIDPAVAANDDADTPSIAITPTGAFVAYTSTATNLNGHAPREVYVVELRNDHLYRVSCHAKACNDAAATPSVTSSSPSVAYVDSAAGTSCQYAKCLMIAYETNDPTVASTAAGASQVVVASSQYNPAASVSLQPGFDRWKTVSTAYDNAGVGADAPSYRPVLDAGGQRVAYLSDASNLVGPGWGYSRRAYTSGTGGGKTYHLTGGNQTADPVWGPDEVAIGGSGLGATVAISSPGWPDQLSDNTALEHVFRVRADHDDNKGPVWRVDHDASGKRADGDAQTGVAVSADGNTVVFASGAPVLGGGAEFHRIYARRIDSDRLDLVSLPTGTQPLDNGNPSAHLADHQRSVSANGRYVLFTSRAHDLSDADDDAHLHVYRRDLATGATELVDRADGRDGAGGNRDAVIGSISDDGRRAAFMSEATNLGTDTSLLRFAYVRDFDTGQTILASRVNGPGGTPSDVPPNGQIAISGDGNRVAFESGPIDSETEGSNALYVRDLAAETTTYVDRKDGPHGRALTGGAALFAIDYDGDRVVWSTEHPYLEIGATLPGIDSVYMRDLSTSHTTLISRGTGATAPQANADSGHGYGAETLSIDHDGRRVVFSSAATNLGADPRGHSQLWMRDTATDTTTLVSRAAGPGGLAAGADVWSSSLSADGQRLAFMTSAGDLGVPTTSPTQNLAWVRDLGTGALTLASRAPGADGAPTRNVARMSMSADGQCVAFTTRDDLGDGFPTVDYSSTHLRAVGDGCAAVLSPPPPPPPPPGGGDGDGGRPGGPGRGGPGGPGTTPAPKNRLTKLALKPATFAVRRGTRGGSKLSFRLDRAAAVTLTLERRLTGHRVGKKKMCSTAKKAKGKACITYKKAGSVSVPRAKAGANAVTLTGRVGKAKALAPGRYRLVATTRDGAKATVAFTIIRNAGRQSPSNG